MKVSLTPEQGRAKVLSLIFLFIMVVGSVGLDQVSKHHAQANLMVDSHPDDLRIYRGQRYPLWATSENPPLPEEDRFYLSFNFNYVRNQGAAWGFMSDLPDHIRIPLFNAITALAVLLITFYLRATPLGHRVARYALVLILSGALGNFIDRMIHGYVIDFIDVHWKILGWRYFFPNFNVADSAISLGVMLLIFDMLVLENVRRNKLLIRAPS